MTTTTRRPFPIFEESGSPLYYSDDARLHVVHELYPEDVHEDGTPIALPRRWYRVILIPAEREDLTTAETVFATFDRVKADAYVAGYDLAHSIYRKAVA